MRVENELKNFEVKDQVNMESDRESTDNVVNATILAKLDQNRVFQSIYVCNSI